MFYRQYDGVGDADEEQMLNFWKETIYEYCFSVENTFGVRTDHLVKKFTLHDRVPCCLPSIMKELKSKNSLATRDDIYSGALFGKNSEGQSGGGKRAFVAGVARSMASGLFNNTFGYLLGGSTAAATGQNETGDDTN